MKILLIEDDRKTAEFLLKALQEAGYTTLYAADGQAGLEMAKTETFDLGIIDIMASGPIPSWEIDGETVSDFILGGSKITADGDRKSVV